MGILPLLAVSSISTCHYYAAPDVADEDGLFVIIHFWEPVDLASFTCLILILVFFVKF